MAHKDNVTPLRNGAAGGARPDVKTAFAEFATGLGLSEPKGGFIADGKLHRCDVAANPRDKKDAGSYQLFSDGIPAGWAQNWTNGAGPQNWSLLPENKLAPAERAELRQRMEQARREREAEEKRRHNEAARQASEIWNRSNEAPADHPYLALKRVSPQGLRIDADGRLIIPLRDENGELQSLQSIAADGTKRFLTGGRKRGLFYVIGEIDPAGRMLICEGLATAASCHEATGLAAFVAFDCGNLLPVTEVVRLKYPDAAITICGDDDFKTNGNPGKTKAEEAAKAIGVTVALPLFTGERNGGTDFNDLAQIEGLDAVVRCIEAAAPSGAGADHDADIDRLAGLKALEYERVRETEAKGLGIRVSALDEIVKKRRQELAEKAKADADACAGSRLEPWPDHVNGSELMREIIEALRKHVILPDHAGEAIAAWILHAHAHDAAAISPILGIVSPEKRCGKTTLLSILYELTPNPLMAANITAAAVYRAVEAWRPTLLVDEADTFLAERDELRGVINSGHNRRSASVVRVVEIGGEQTPVKFSTWAPKAIAQIKDLPDTLQDRSVAIRLRRKLSSEKVARFRADRVRHLTEINRRAARWAADNMEALREIDADTPHQLHDRAADNWRTLLNIAEHIGGEWPEKLRAAALALEGIGDGDVEPELTDGVRLLMDCKGVFENRGATELSARAIIDDLCDIDESHWTEYRAGKRITEHAFAKLLKPFGVTSKMASHGENKGRKFWSKSAFRDAWRRYIPAEGENFAFQSSTSSTSLKNKDFLDPQSSTTVELCNGKKPNKINGVEVVELQTPDFTLSGGDIPDEGPYGAASSTWGGEL